MFLLVVCTAMPFRATAAPEPPIKPVAFGPTDDAAYAIAGRSLVIAVAPDAGTEAAAAVAPDRVPLVTINARPVDATRCMLVRPSNVAGAGGWEPEARGWTAIPMGVPDRRGRSTGPGKRADEPGFWAILVDAPPDLERPVISVNGRAAPVVWLDPPPPVTGAGRPVRPVASAEAWLELGERLRPLALDPQQRWRVRLLSDRVSPDELWGAAPPAAFNDRLVEAWATRQEECWRCAIEELRRVDPVLSSDLLHALSAVVSLPGGVLVPAWPLDEISTQRLLRSLLDPAETRSRKAEYTRAWLAAAPDAVAWVIDDADPRGPTLGVAELSGRRANVAMLFSAVPVPLMRSVVAHESISARLPRPAVDDLDEPIDLTAIEVRAENWQGRLSAATRPVPIRPPGLITGPFFRAATHASWLSGVSSPATGALATSALVQPGIRAGSWQVYVQGAAPADGTTDDRVTLWFGPFSDPSVVLTLDRSGASTLKRRGEKPQPVDVHFGAIETGWTALVDVPAEAVSDDSVLLVGMDRTLAGQRASWPRAVLPGQAEPGRLAVDLSTWGSLSGD